MKNLTDENSLINPLTALKDFFGYDAFRTYNNEPLQERVVRSALSGESVLTVLPTGGGKSITFQLPALMEWKRTGALTVVISPLQSLMKDQVDNLLKHHITEAATINGLLTAVERAGAVKRTEEGDVAIIYVSPEQLRSGTFARLVRKRTIARFVIDEAHCLSSWGHDFRVDYLYIGEFLRELKQSKSLQQSIPVSCFTATAKQQVINEITKYFYEENALALKLFRTPAERTNLHYHVTECAGDAEKYDVLRKLIQERERPTIIYVSRTGRAEELAAKLCKDQIEACPFHGQMNTKDKIENQDAFIRNDVRVMVATSAFGMGVDKKDIGLVIHHDIPSSLEAYLQESGRAGRDPSLEADCHLLYNENDLNDHFSLYSYSKITRDDINRIWGVVKKRTPTGEPATYSANELARYAGWYAYGKMRQQDIETKVLVCLSALERAGYLRRLRNTPISFANSLREHDIDAVAKCIDESRSLNDSERDICFKIMNCLIAAHEKKNNGDATDEKIRLLTQIDHLAVKFGTTKRQIMHGINMLREIELLTDDLDITAIIRAGVKYGHLSADLRRFHNLEALLFSSLRDGVSICRLKVINDAAENLVRAESGIGNIRMLLDVHAMRHDLCHHDFVESHTVQVELLRSKELILSQIERRYALCEFILNEILKSVDDKLPSECEMRIPFSVVSVLNAYRNEFEEDRVTDQVDVEDALLFMQQIGVIGLTGGFTVGYNRLKIERIVRDERAEYTEKDYAPFRNFYRHKNESVHIAGEYARLMIKSPDVAANYVRDYFLLDFEDFVKKHFKNLHTREIKRRMTEKRYKDVFGCLSDAQQAVIENSESEIVNVVAGPGSGKTHLLIHKLASLLLSEETPTDQVLALTFTQSAAMELKLGLKSLAGGAANGVEIKTFNGYCMDLLGRSHIPLKTDKCIGIGRDACLIERGCVACATEAIVEGRTEFHRITKSVLLIDEAQEMGKDEYALVRALMDRNAHMRIIAAGDDDQNIFRFKGASVKAFRKLIALKGAAKYEPVENHRSVPTVVDFSNAYVATLQNRLKSKPAISLSNDVGRVEIVEYASENFEERFVDQLIASMRQCRTMAATNAQTEENPTTHHETFAVFAQTNNEASILTGILLRRGIRAKLIQSDDRIKLSNLAEMRYFMRHLNVGADASIISNEQWNNACAKLSTTYAKSACLGLCNNILRKFKALHENECLIGEFEEFLDESSFEDFQEAQENAVMVSTLHKAKGREFDSVFLFLKNMEVTNDDQRRLLFVAITRARKNVFVHCNTPVFAEVKAYATSYRIDSDENLQPPETLSFMLTYHDMHLGYFVNYKTDILRLRSGMDLKVKDEFVFAGTETGIIPVGRFSKGFSGRMKELGALGYVPMHARVSLILAWRRKEGDRDNAVLLPFITFGRKKEIAV